VYIKMNQNNFVHFTQECFLCGESFYLGSVAFELYDAADRVGDICYECVTLDADAQAGKLSNHAARLRHHTEWLEEIATEGFPRLRLADAQAWEAWQEECAAARKPRADDDIPF
jgi:hypothetical protein